MCVKWKPPATSPMAKTRLLEVRSLASTVMPRAVLDARTVVPAASKQRRIDAALRVR